MATLAQISKPGDNGLGGWGYWLGGSSGMGDFDQGRVNSSSAQDFLARLHKYDPSANFRATGELGGEGGGGGMHYTLDYDASKLPGGDRPAMVDMNHGAFEGLHDDPNAGYGGHLYRSDAVSKDPNGYGTVTSPRNMNLAADDDTGWVGHMGPALIAAIATVMSGGAASPLLISAMTQAPQMMDNASHGNFNPMQLAGMVAQGFGVPSWATGAASTAYGLSQGRKPSIPGSAMSLANIVSNVGPGG